MKLCAGMACILAIAAIGSCVFQNEPLAPNKIPQIVSFSPTVSYVILTVPDSCSFQIGASDPDGDQLAYSFFIGDSLFGTQGTAMFRAVKAGMYSVRGEARDTEGVVSHNWVVSVFEQKDDPPVITWFIPEQEMIACAVGDGIDFHLSAEDDHPGALTFLYLMDSKILQAGSPDFSNRFLDRGEFLIRGVAWDGQNGDTMQWHVTVTGFPDTIQPGPINDLQGAPGDVNGSIRLQWTTPGDDGIDGRAASYIVKTSTAPILTEADWAAAQGKPGEPVPGEPGTPDSMIIGNLPSTSIVHVTLRAVDDFFNLSPLGNSIAVLVRGVDVGGRVINAVTGEGLGEITIAMSSKQAASESDGSYFLWNVPSYSYWIRAFDEIITFDPGEYYDIYFSLSGLKQYNAIDFCMIPVLPLVNPVEPDPYQGRFLFFFKEMTQTTGDLGKPTVLKKWNHWPISVYNPPRFCREVDLQAAARGAMAEWESETGLDLFTETASETGADVLLVYYDEGTHDHHYETSAYNPDGTPAQRKIHIYLLNTSVPMWRFAHLVFAHELGHVLGLSHSRNIGHLMVGLTFPQVHHVTVDEANVVKAMYHFPPIFDFKQISEE